MEFMVSIDRQKKRIIETLWPIVVTATPNRVDFARGVCDILEEYEINQAYLHSHETVFPDSERFFQFQGNCRDREVFIISSTEQPDDNLWNLISLADSAKTMSSASRVTILFTYFGYARGDRKDMPRKNVPSATVTKCLKAVDVDRVMILDPHFSQLQSMFYALNIKCDLLFATDILSQRIASENFPNLIISTVDNGGQKIVQDYSARLNRPFIIVLKQRQGNLIKIIGDGSGNIQGATILIGDDLTATLGSIIETAKLYKKKGANKIFASLSHFVCSAANEDILLNNLKQPCLDGIFITDSLPLTEEVIEHPKIFLVSAKKLMAKVIFNTYYRLSISQLFALPKK